MWHAAVIVLCVGCGRIPVLLMGAILLHHGVRERGGDIALVIDFHPDGICPHECVAIP